MSVVEVRLRRRLEVRGVVQGVGFRPHVATLATSLGLSGTCHHDLAAVLIDVEGPASVVATFERRLVAQAPALARISSIRGVDLPPSGAARGFAIVSSTESAGEPGLLPPDTATCAECLAELRDPADRRYRHPFIGCTDCGPRLTVAIDLPYDRSSTTMAGFALCPRCLAEYSDPADRRYHAQPISCRDCGPVLTARSPEGAVVASGDEETLAAVVWALHAGWIVAIKGVGGYHLACDAGNDRAVAMLRTRKHRPEQPLAVMAKDLATAEAIAEVGSAGPLLTCPERPIVLLPMRHDSGLISAGVAPGLDMIGVMLPQTGLHDLLFTDLPVGAPGAPDVLVMTSGNPNGEPICHTDADARERLWSIADLFCEHSREIAAPCDDSVIAWDESIGAIPVRRSRGFTPLPVPLDQPGVVVLAAGGEIKNTVTLVRDGQAFGSAHVGDLGASAGGRAHRRATEQLLRFHRAEPDLVVADQHPGYTSRTWAVDYAARTGVPLLEVQHHHAHLASLAAERDRLDRPLLGLVFDGSGYGCDATIWGGELLVLTEGGTRMERLGHLGTVRLPGIESGIRHPVRTAALALLDAGLALARTPLAEQLSGVEISALTRMYRAGTGVVSTTSVGRLFDVVSALLSVRPRSGYEAQAAIELESIGRRWRRDHPDATPLPLALPVRLDPRLPTIDPVPLIRQLLELTGAGASAGEISWAFHQSLAVASADLALMAADSTGIREVGLSGGVFVNRILLDACIRELRERDLEPLWHRTVPSTDGGLSLGQAAVGARWLSRGRPATEVAR